MKVTLLHFGLIALLASPAAALSTQDADESALDAFDNVSKPAVIKQDPPGAVELRDAVRRIAQRPTDSYALTDAGYAAVKLGDYDAAYNFFTKANAIQPSDGRIKAGLGIAQVRRENPFEALSLFDEALRLGASERSFALDRALAFDLLGNFDRAERDYALAASYGPSDELALRHAISLSLAGKRDEADRMLIPMLQKENPEAWRTRAMMLAARGDHREASKIAQGFLSESEARRMDGYFRNMPRLTAAQQAAALHFGHFPVGSNIGEDSNAVVSLAAATGARPVAPVGDSRLIPTGEPLGAKTAAKPEKPKKPVKKDKDEGKRASGVTTASAQQAIDNAAKAKVTTVAAAKLPPPESARPPVRIALPALARPQPVALPPAENRPAQSELPPIGPAVGAVPQTIVFQSSVAEKPQPAPPVIQTPVVQPSPQPEIRIAQIDPATVLAGPKAPIASAANVTLPPVEQKPVQGPPATTIDIGPGFESLPAKPASVPEAVVIPAQSSPEVVVVQAPPEQQVVVVQTQPLPEVIEAKPAPVTIAEKPFDLGALVASIDVPDSEKKPSVAPVDLKKIKPAPKAEPASTKPDAKAAKQPAAGPRIWVQIATGSDVNGLGFDYRRMAKKNAALFAKLEGWTATWGKTKRLLVGPFADMKAAKKWEADFRKGGGDGFVWQSDKTSDVAKLK
jgi:Flp pilus assembly protein TadD